MTNEVAEVAEVTNHAYVFSPEEPFLQIFIEGRLLKFNNGRLDTKGGQYALSQHEVQWFMNSQEATRSIGRDGGGNPQPRFVVWMDSMGPLAQAAPLLMERVMMTCGKKAWADNIVKVQDDMRFTMAVMLSDEHGVADITPSPIAGLQALQNIMPSAVEAAGKLLGYDPGLEAPNTAQADADAAVIRAAAERQGVTAEAEAPDAPPAPTEMAALAQQPDAEPVEVPPPNDFA